MNIMYTSNQASANAPVSRMHTNNPVYLNAEANLTHARNRACVNADMHTRHTSNQAYVNAEASTWHASNSIAANVLMHPVPASNCACVNADVSPMLASNGASPAPGRYRSRLAGRRNSGMTLLEVLVALFILSLMTLGTFAMQEITLTSAINIDHHTAAERLADEFSNYYNVYTTGNAQQALLNNFIFDDTAVAFPGECNTATIAVAAPANVNDTLGNFLNCWRSRVRDTLPAGRAVITFVGDPAISPEINVQIRWSQGTARNIVNIIAG